jgi:hypothetical protein
MARRGQTQPPRRELSRLRERLDEWRQADARSMAIPGKLWAAAGQAARRHGVHLTSRMLGLEYNKLKRVSGGTVVPSSGAAKKPAVPKAVKLIELTGALPVSAGGCRLSLRGPGGQRLQLEMEPAAAAEMVLQLCRSGWAGS